MFAELGWGGFDDFWTLPVLVKECDLERSRRLLRELGGSEDEWGIWLWESRLQILPVSPDGFFLWENYRHPLTFDTLNSPPLYQIGYLELPSVPLELLKVGYRLKHGLPGSDVKTTESRNPRLRVSFSFKT